MKVPRRGSVRARARSTGVETVSPVPPAPISTPLFEIDPMKIRIVAAPTSEVAKLQPLMSKAIWRPYGRRLAFKVVYDDALLGIVFLTCPVIQLTARDQAFAFATNGMLPLPGKGQRDSKGRKRTDILKHYAEMSICVGAQPIGWYWNLGKLCAMLATTLSDEWREHLWANAPHHVDLYGITTTSLNGGKWSGRGTQYSRIYKYLGETKGFGHEHISEERYQGMLQWMRDNRVEIPSSKFGAGSNPRMRRILAYRRASGDNEVTLKHGKKRGVYYAQARPTSERPLVIKEWYERWGKPRYDRTKNLTAPYQDGKSTRQSTGDKV